MLLFVLQKNPRTTAILAVAKANGLDLESVFVDTTNPTPEYLKLNKLGKVPTFEGTDGYVLSECMAIAIYRKNNPSPSLGAPSLSSSVTVHGPVTPMPSTRGFAGLWRPS